ncbi:hypothetical protein OJNDCHOG_02040 [Klebsiella phage 150049]|uniref:Uncharacterized protein n=1 Tax=Klebsiella phage 150049 TaxID=2979597 RepID=A0A977KDQ2_9CAUD|nr:hypothetical protein OJNDCHOG_02040 [Klebsiella phage 150049]
MSRTYRKQSGDRHWRDAHRSKFNFTLGYNRRFFALKEPAVPYTREEIEKELQDDIIKYEKKDGYNWDSVSRNVKWHSNKMVRQGNRYELHHVMKDPENYDYNRDHDLRKRGLWWCYD